MSANLRQASSRAVNASSVGRMQVGLEFRTERARITDDTETSGD